MGAPILWAPAMFAFFLQANLHVHNIARLGGGGWAFGGGGECRFYLSGRGVLSDIWLVGRGASDAPLTTSHDPPAEGKRMGQGKEGD